MLGKYAQLTIFYSDQVTKIFLDLTQKSKKRIPRIGYPFGQCSEVKLVKAEITIRYGRFEKLHRLVVLLLVY